MFSSGPAQRSTGRAPAAVKSLSVSVVSRPRSVLFLPRALLLLGLGYRLCDPSKNIASMASTDSFCLQWNEFGSSLTKSLRSIRSERDFFDVTLACEDNQIFAHKLILAASSPFFRKILKANPHNHPLLYLKGVKYKELMSILEFLYMGQVRLKHCCDNETMSNSCPSSGEHR